VLKCDTLYSFFVDSIASLNVYTHVSTDQFANWAEDWQVLGTRVGPMPCKGLKDTYKSSGLPFAIRRMSAGSMDGMGC